MNFNISEIRKILIIRLSSLGDIILTTPLIRSIKRKNPSCKIDFILREEFDELLSENPHINKIYKYTNHKFEKHILFNSLLDEEYDFVFDLQNNLHSREIVRILKRPYVKFKKNNFRKFLLVKFKINMLKDCLPVPVRYAETAGIFEPDNEGPEFYTSRIPDSRLKGNKNNIGICAGAKHFTKRWPKDYFIRLAEKLIISGYNVALFGGPEEAQICFDIEERLKTVLNLCNTSLQQAGADMMMCKAIYTNDSGLMHLASAVKTPVIAFFGSTVKEFGFYPYNSKSIVLENGNLSCRPCTHIGRKSCPQKHFNCMLKITPDEAFNSISKLITMP